MIKIFQTIRDLIFKNASTTLEKAETFDTKSILKTNHNIPETTLKEVKKEVEKQEQEIIQEEKQKEDLNFLSEIITCVEDFNKFDCQNILINSNIDLEGKTIIIPNDTNIKIEENSSLSNGVLNISSGCVINSFSDIPCDKLKIVPKGKNISITGLKWQNTGIALYSLNNCTGLSLKRCEIKSTNNNAIKIVADKISTVDKNIEFKNCDIFFERMGAEIQNHGNEEYKISNVYFYDCLFTNISASDYGYGISLTGYGENVIINGCEFNECVKGIEIVGFKNVTIDGNEFANISKYAIISSNDREMSNIKIENNISDAGYYIYNTINSIIQHNKITCKYIEIKNSNNVVFMENDVTSTGHYSIMLNQASKNIIKENTITQNSNSNWSVIRCYGEKSINNYISNNIITRKKKAGKIWDQYNGASGNIFD